MKQFSLNRFFIQEHLFRSDIYHGGIGNRDIETVLLHSGYTPIVFPYHYDFSLKAKFFRLLHLLKLLFSLPSDATVFFQAPLYARMNVLLLRLLAKFRKSIKIICFITDINGLKDNNLKLLQEEQQFYGNFQNFIVHNSSMRKWLLRLHPNVKVAALEFFAFLAEPVSFNRKKTAEIAFAGFLDKSRFIFQLKELRDVTFHLYGPTNLPITKNVFDGYYHGIYKPTEMPRIIQGAFGLVWDGDSINGLSGTYGMYNRLISPHKLSLYILSGLPVIAHHQSGAAQLIHKYQIGFTVSNLDEIHGIIESMTEEEYQFMQKNCFPLAEKISTGNCFLKALSLLD